MKIRPLPTWVRIVEVCYGASQVRNQEVWKQIYLDGYNGVATSIENDVIGDSWYGNIKSAVLWYRDTRNGDDGPLYIITGKEHDKIKLMDRNGNFRRQLELPGPDGEGSSSNVAEDSDPSYETDPEPILPTDTITTLLSTTATTATTMTTLSTTSTDTLSATTTTTSPASTTTAASASGDNTFVVEEMPKEGVATIRDTTGSLQLHPAINGNLFLALTDTTEELNLLTNNVVMGAMVLPPDSPVPYLINTDSTERLLHYFPDEVSHVGASRLRLAAWEKLPVGSRLVSLAPIPLPSGGSVTEPLLVAIDGATGDYLFPVMCAIEGQLDKVFLVKDVSDAALRALEAEDLKFVLTGGQASQCGPLALTASVVEKE
jgi:hypothetical protein